MTDITTLAPDWERIEADYRAGILSIREIATLQGITEGAIRKRAKRDNWARDLHGKVIARADALILKATCPELPGSDHQVIELNASAIAEVQITHRKEIGRAFQVLTSLMKELAEQSDNAALFGQLGELLRDPSDTNMEKLNDIYEKVISMPGRVAALKTLSDALKNVVKLEREAYGMDMAPIPGNATTVQQNTTVVTAEVVSNILKELDDEY